MATKTGTEDLVSSIELIGTADGAPAKGGYSLLYGGNAALSPDGTKIVFSTGVRDPLASSQAWISQIVTEDLETGAINVLTKGDADSSQASFSPDGTKVVFASLASNLVPGDSNGAEDVFVLDLATGAITRVSTAANGAQGVWITGNPNGSYNPVFSPDGSKVAFTSAFSNLVPGDNTATNSPDWDVFIKDLNSGAITRIPGAAQDAVFSPDGTKLLFSSWRSDLVAGDTNNELDLFLKDLATGAITRVSTDSNGKQVSGGRYQGDNGSYLASFSPDGRKIVFLSTASNLVAGDTNGTTDVFVKDLTTGVVTRISTASDGSQGTDNTGNDIYGSFVDWSRPVFSPDGSMVAFSSDLDNLVPGDANKKADYFVKDLATGQLIRVDTDAAGNLGSGPADLRLGTQNIAFTPDGSAVVFTTNQDLLNVGNVAASADSLIYLKHLIRAPLSAKDSYAVSYSKPLTIDAAHGVLANDSGRNKQPLVANLASGAAHGAVTLAKDGSFTYRPSGDFVGQDSFTYIASDSLTAGAETTVTIKVIGNITRVDTNASDAQAYSGADYEVVAFSPDGGKIAFISRSGDLVGGGTEMYAQVFVKDLRTGAISEISKANGAAQFQGILSPKFSPDGAKLAYVGYTASGGQIVVTDIATKISTIVSVNGGAQSNRATNSPVFSPDGTRIAFASDATNLVAGDANNTADIFVVDLASGAIISVSTTAQGGQSNDYSALPVFSPDGTRIAFTSMASNLVAGDTNATPDIFIKDLVTGAVTRVSTDSNGGEIKGYFDQPVFSPDGTKIAFTSTARSLLGGAGSIGLFIKDLTTGALTRVDTAADGTPAVDTGASALFPVFSPDGSQIAFSSQASNLVPGDNASNGHVFVKNLITGAIRDISTDSFGALANGWATQPVFSPDGLSVAFFSYASNLAPGDTNNTGDVFIKDLTVFPLGSADNAPPVATNDAYSVGENQSLKLAASGVLGNDSDPNGTALTAVLDHGPKHGALALNADGGFSYQPNAGYAGTDSFTYWASDGVNTSGLAKVTLTVTPADTWKGAPGGAWSDPANWSSGKVPGPTDDALIDGASVTITTDVGALRSLTVTNTATLTVNGGALSVSGDVANSGVIDVEGGTLGIGGKVSGEGSITVHGDAHVTLGAFSGSTSVSLLSGTLILSDPGAAAGIITGFDSQDVIDVLGFAFTADARVTLLPNNVLEIQNGAPLAAAQRLALAAVQQAQTFDLQLDPGADFSGQYFHLASDGQTGVDITVDALPCYCAGTLILTATGERPVETLEIGDLVVTASGARRPVKWLGHRRLDVSKHPAPQDVWPVRIAAGAFEDKLPRRDLWVSPGHNIAWDGALMPAIALANGHSVAQVAVGRVEYWHVELDAHDILLAEGLPAESYLDCGNRVAFANGGVQVEAHPDFKPKHWADTCLPLLKHGPQVAAAKARLIARLKQQGFALTPDTQAHILADGRKIEPVWLSPSRMFFVVPEGAKDIALMSKTFTPAHATPDSYDTRELGLCVERLQIDGADVALERDDALGAGWREAECDDGAFARRWTDGRARLPASGRLFMIDLGGEGRYWREPTDNVVALFG
ncbi:hypothetical protein CCR94_20820 [Rhodoblastus sphagnicola]|uniref:Hedgehog/Intein (Hint) domain-containing protein n=1 Tax=Rhodoblastus sphagnicola TaxID=333368 RepID=A0A2S6MXN4_9HYPH|nr:Hint domain-containing protein [Rhodoblastus sphagnicola]MBB4196769.1 Tol biopolymer transport system component [Rhodoblastus sphagnicola]PPQ27121.1 hypothetical protein CCR94_20820 [Rhodoblastus sphagnicola]